MPVALLCQAIATSVIRLHGTTAPRGTPLVRVQKIARLDPRPRRLRALRNSHHLRHEEYLDLSPSLSESKQTCHGHAAFNSLCYNLPANRLTSGHVSYLNSGILKKNLPWEKKDVREQ